MTVRRLIRDRALALLAGLPTTGARVWPRRELQPLQRDELPALLVAVDAGRGTFNTASFGTFERSATLVIEALAERDVTDLDDVMESVWSEVEVALAADPTLAGAIKHLGDWDLSSRQTEPAGDLIVVRQALLIQCHWYAPFGQPAASL